MSTSSAPARGRTVREVRVPFAPVILALAGLVASVWLLLAVRGTGMFADEWYVVTHIDGWGVLDYLRPHNEHWSTLPLLVYRVLLSTVGAASPLPYQAVLLLAHVGAAVALFLIVRRRAGDVVALVAAVTLLFLAHGGENLFWAFQMGFDGSVALGLLALYLLDRPAVGPVRIAGASAALVAALACSGVGLFFVVAVALLVALEPGGRHRLWVLAAPVAAYAAWYVVFGRAAAVHGFAFGPQTAPRVSVYVLTGVGAALAGLLALSPAWGPAALVAGGAAAALALTREPAGRPLVIAAVGAMAAQFLLIALVRAELGPGQATSGRYLYVAAVFGLLAFAEALGALPWHGIGRAVLVGLVAAVTLGNLVGLAAGLHRQRGLMSQVGASLQTAWILRDAPDLDPDGWTEPMLTPGLTARAYLAARARYGSPYPAGVGPADLDGLDAAAVNRTTRALLPLRARADGGTGEPGGDCRWLGPAAQAQSSVWSVTDGVVIRVLADPQAPRPLSFGQWLLGPAFDGIPTEWLLSAGEELSVTTPVSGLGLARQVVVTVPTGIRARVCLEAPR